MRGFGNGRTDRKTNGRTLVIVRTEYYIFSVFTSYSSIKFNTKL